MSNDTEDDLRQYLPGRDRARELADTRAAEERIARALDNAGLLAPGEGAPDGASPAPEQTTGTGEAHGTRDASPALPATPLTLPAPAKLQPHAAARRDEPEATTISSRPGPRTRSRRWSAPVVTVLAALCVIAPVALSLLLVKSDGRDSAHGVAGTISAATAPSAPASLSPPAPHGTEPPALFTGAPMIDATAPPSTAPAATSTPATTGAPAAAASTSSAGPGPAPPKPSGKKPEPPGKNPPSLPAGPTAAPSSTPTAPPEPTGAAPRYTDPDF